MFGSMFSGKYLFNSYTFILVAIIAVFTMSLNVLRVKAPAKVTGTVIILHGLGDSADGWKFLSDMLHQYDQFKGVNFIFPNAPIKPLTVAGGQRVAQWFDIFEMGNPNARQDEEGYWNSVANISKLIDEESKNGVNPSKIIVGGFSQGASISLGIAASYHQKLAGILCLSGFFNMKQGIQSRLKDVNKQTPIFHGHGDLDPVINISMARAAHKLFTDNLGFTNYDLHEYSGMAHSTCNEEISEIADFIAKNLGL